MLGRETGLRKGPVLGGLHGRVHLRETVRALHLLRCEAGKPVVSSALGPLRALSLETWTPESQGQNWHVRDGARPPRSRLCSHEEAVACALQCRSADVEVATGARGRTQDRARGWGSPQGAPRLTTTRRTARHSEKPRHVTYGHREQAPRAVPRQTRPCTDPEAGDSVKQGVTQRGDRTFWKGPQGTR